MTGIVKPCPWCRDRDIAWRLSGFTDQATVYCVGCEASAPEFHVKNRLDKDAINAAAINAWNGAR